MDKPGEWSRHRTDERIGEEESVDSPRERYGSPQTATFADTDAGPNETLFSAPSGMNYAQEWIDAIVWGGRGCHAITPTGETVNVWKRTLCEGAANMPSCENKKTVQSL